MMVAMCQRRNRCQYQSNALPFQIAFVPETPSTIRALFSFLFGRWRHIGRVVVEVLVPLQHLLPPEALVTLVALEGFLICVD